MDASNYLKNDYSVHQRNVNVSHHDKRAGNSNKVPPEKQKPKTIGKFAAPVENMNKTRPPPAIIVGGGGGGRIISRQGNS